MMRILIICIFSLIGCKTSDVMVGKPIDGRILIEFERHDNEHWEGGTYFIQGNSKYELLLKNEMCAEDERLPSYYNIVEDENFPDWEPAMVKSNKNVFINSKGKIIITFKMELILNPYQNLSDKCKRFIASKVCNIQNINKLYKIREVVNSSQLSKKEIADLGLEFFKEESFEYQACN